MSVINSGPKRKDYSDHSRIGPKERALNNNYDQKNEPTIYLPSGVHTQPKPKTNPETNPNPNPNKETKF